MMYFTYDDVFKAATRVANVLDYLKIRNETILIILPDDHTYLLPAILLGIMKTSNSFFCINLGKSIDIDEIIVKCNISSIVSQPSSSDFVFRDKEVIDCYKILILNEENIDVSRIHKRNSSEAFERMQIGYCMQTSGSTGSPKIVQVPWSCIIPNISALSKRLNITSNDVIYSTSPATFDPFIVDLLLTISNNATMLLTTERLRLAPSLNFAKEMFEKQVTFLQITPTLLLNFGQETLHSIVLSEKSSLRICLLGGEIFPERPLLQKSKNHIKFYNIYGITEISCWTHMRLVDLESEEEVDIGEELDETVETEIRKSDLILQENFGILWIGSKRRKCIVGNESSDIIHGDEILFRNTGDIVEQKNGRIFFRGRANKIIKKFGIQIDLAKIEDAAKKVDTIERVCCIFIQTLKKIILFYKSNNSDNLSFSKLKLNLKMSEMPDEIHKIVDFPQSTHGKICERKLVEIYEILRKETNLTVEENFIQHIEQLLTSHYTLSLSFSALGGDSVTALRILADLETTYKQEYPELLPLLLNPDISLQNAIKYLKESFQSSPIRNTRPIKFLNPKGVKLKWRTNLGKCVDASPAVHTSEKSTSVTVGSHSHRLITIDMVTGNTLYEEILEDRIEGQAVFCPKGFGYIGCYRGFLYKFSIFNKAILWKFDSGSMIKSRPIIIDDAVIFGNYSTDKNVWCLNRLSGDLMWSSMIGSKGIFTNPLRIDDQILVASLDGSVAILNSNNGFISSQIKLNTPIFSTPTVIKFKNANPKIALAEVNGTIHILSLTNNQLKLTGNPFKVSGNVFSKIIKLNPVDEQSEQSALLAFGCHNNCVYCLKIALEEPFLAIQWKTKLNSPVFSTPCSINEDYMMCCTTSGFLAIMNSKTGTVESTVQLPGESFSSPVYHEGHIFIGCRDNFLYCYTF
ncbi:Beta-alanine-activating enzyme [Sergentomyia squamirostris]